MREVKEKNSDGVAEALVGQTKEMREACILEAEAYLTEARAKGRKEVRIQGLSDMMKKKLEVQWIQKTKTLGVQWTQMMKKKLGVQ